MHPAHKSSPSPKDSQAPSPESSERRESRLSPSLDMHARRMHLYSRGNRQLGTELENMQVAALDLLQQAQQEQQTRFTPPLQPLPVPLPLRTPPELHMHALQPEEKIAINALLELSVSAPPTTTTLLLVKKSIKLAATPPQVIAVMEQMEKLLTEVKILQSKLTSYRIEKKSNKKNIELQHILQQEITSLESDRKRIRLKLTTLRKKKYGLLQTKRAQDQREPKETQEEKQKSRQDKAANIMKDITKEYKELKKLKNKLAPYKLKICKIEKELKKINSSKEDNKEEKDSNKKKNTEDKNILQQKITPLENAIETKKLVIKRLHKSKNRFLTSRKEKVSTIRKLQMKKYNRLAAKIKKDLIKAQAQELLPLLQKEAQVQTLQPQ